MEKGIDIGKPKIELLFKGKYYPDCPNADIKGENNCTCKLLKNAEGCSCAGNYWCTVAQEYQECPVRFPK